MLEAIEIFSQRRTVVEIDVGAVEIEVFWREEFGGRIVRVGDQTIRRLLLGGVDELLDESLDAIGAIEANDVVRNFVADADRKDARMPAQLARGFAHLLDGVFLRVPIFKKAAMLVPRHVDQHAKVVLQCIVEQRDIGAVIQANRIASKRTQVLKILEHAHALGKMAPSRLGLNGP